MNAVEDACPVGSCTVGPPHLPVLFDTGWFTEDACPVGPAARCLSCWTCLTKLQTLIESQPKSVDNQMVATILCPDRGSTH